MKSPLRGHAEAAPQARRSLFTFGLLEQRWLRHLPSCAMHHRPHAALVGGGSGVLWVLSGSDARGWGWATAMRKLRIVTQGLARRDREWPWTMDKTPTSCA